MGLLSRGKKRKRRRKGRTMFQPAKHKGLSETVRIDDPRAARKAAKQLEREFRERKTRKAKVRRKRAAVQAANRAEAHLKRRNLSRKERKEMRQVADAYRKAADRMELEEE